MKHYFHLFITGNDARLPIVKAFNLFISFAVSIIPVFFLWKCLAGADYIYNVITYQWFQGIPRGGCSSFLTLFQR